jgi:hypothetical protein
MKHLIVITTCERSNILLKNLKLNTASENKEYLIFQDGEFDYSDCKKYLQKNKFNFTWYKWTEKHGKSKFWQVHNEIYKITKTKKFDLCHHIQDDCLICENYFDIVEQMFAKLPEMEVLNTLAVQCHSNRFFRVNEFLQIDKYKIYQLNKLDCNYIAKRIFFKKLNFEVPEISSEFDFRNGSGVGSHTTERYLLKKGKIFNTFPSMLRHVGFASVIGNELKKEQITSIL